MNFGLERVSQTPDWVVGVLLLVFVLLVFVKHFYAERFNALLGAFFSKQYFSEYENELLDFFSVFNYLLFFIQNLLISLVLYFFLSQKVEMFYFQDFVGYLKILLGVSVYLLIHVFVSAILSRALSLYSVFKYINILKYSYLKVVFLFFTPLVILSYYAFSNSLFFLKISIVFLSFLLVLRWVLIIYHSKNIIISKLFYFILYLCALEIAPMLICVKFLSK